MITMIQQEIAKFMNNINPNFLNMVNMLDSSGNKHCFALNAFNSSFNKCWIIDTGASNHISGNIELFDHVYNLKTLATVILPNGSSLKVDKAGDVVLQPNLILTDTLYIPDFKYNLISVHKLTQFVSLKCVFYSQSCVLQEPIYDDVVAIGSLVGNLYVLNEKNKPSTTSLPAKVSSTTLEPRTNTLFPGAAFIRQLQSSNTRLWHQRMGHASFFLLID